MLHTSILFYLCKYHRQEYIDVLAIQKQGKCLDIWAVTLVNWSASQLMMVVVIILFNIWVVARAKCWIIVWGVLFGSPVNWSPVN